MERVSFGAILLVAIFVLVSCKASSVPKVAASPELQTTPDPSQSGDYQEQDIESAFIDGDSLSYEGFDAVKLKKKVKYKYPPEAKSRHDLIEVSYVVLKKNGRVLATFEGFYFPLGNDTDFGLFPFLGGETKQLVVVQTVPRGGRHWISSLSSDYSLIFDSGEYGGWREGLGLLDIDKDGKQEISLSLTDFYNFGNMYMGESPLPEIIFKYDEQKKKYFPANPAFQDYVLREIENDIRQLNPNDEKNYLSKRLDIALRYIYAGDEEEAWSFFNREYRLSDKEEMKAKIKERLKDQAVYKYFYGKRAT